MGLPDGTQYFEAVQNPRIAFQDNELKMCSVETNDLGLPEPYSGGFTTTYHLSNNGQEWAVRCFTREVPELKKRYEAISNYLDKQGLKYFVKAHLIEEGILVGGKRYPIIKMEWVKGEALNRYVQKNISRKDTLKKLTDEFIKMVQFLENLKIAHGDLQHGNIIVRNNNLFLIDYDGIFLPQLAGLRNNEIGHINYQHPMRNGSHYNQNIDRFSSIVIYISLTALSYYPELWNRYNNDENLLFRQEDFINIPQSKLIKELSNLPETSKLIEKFKNVCNLDFDSIPSLDDFIKGNFKVIPALVVKKPVIKRRSQYNIFSVDDKNTINQIGQKITVVGFLSSHYSGESKYGSYLFLNFGKYPTQTFTLTFWSSQLKKFNSLGFPRSVIVSSYSGKWLSVTGVVGSYKGVPQMRIEDLSQIEILPSKEAALEYTNQNNIVGQFNDFKKNDERIFNTIYQTSSSSTTYSSPKTSSSSTTYSSPKTSSSSTTYSSPKTSSSSTTYSSPKTSSSSTTYSSPKTSSSSTTYSSPKTSSSSTTYSSPKTSYKSTKNISNGAIVLFMIIVGFAIIYFLVKYLSIIGLIIVLYLGYKILKSL